MKFEFPSSPAGVNTEEDLQLYMFERTPPAEIAACLEIAKKAGDSLLTAVLEQDSKPLGGRDIITVEDHQESLKDDPTLVLLPISISPASLRGEGPLCCCFAR